MQISIKIWFFFNTLIFNIYFFNSFGLEKICSGYWCILFYGLANITSNKNSLNIIQRARTKLTSSWTFRTEEHDWQITINNIKFGHAANKQIVISLCIKKVKKASLFIPNPNSCSSRIPINRRLNILASIWKTPACNHMHVIRRHPWCLLTTLSTSRAPIFSSLKE